METPKDILKNFNLPSRKQNGANFFTPIESEEFPSSYLTYLEQTMMLKRDKNMQIKPDSNLDLDKCSIEGCLTTFKSAAHQDKHMEMYHPGSTKHFTCTICKEKLKTRYLLTKHRKKHRENNQK